MSHELIAANIVAICLGIAFSILGFVDYMTY